MKSHINIINMATQRKNTDARWSSSNKNINVVVVCLLPNGLKK